MKRITEVSPEVQEFLTFMPGTDPETKAHRQRRSKALAEIKRIATTAAEASESARAAALKVVEAEIDGAPQKELAKLKAEADRMAKEAAELRLQAQNLPSLPDGWNDTAKDLAHAASTNAFSKVRSRLLDNESELAFHARELLRLTRETRSAVKHATSVGFILAAAGIELPKSVSVCNLSAHGENALEEFFRDLERAAREWEAP